MLHIKKSQRFASLKNVLGGREVLFGKDDSSFGRRQVVERARQAKSGVCDDCIRILRCRGCKPWFVGGGGKRLKVSTCDENLISGVGSTSTDWQ